MTKDELLKLVTVLQAELEATNRQVEILSDALAESRREVAALKAVQEPVAWVREHELPLAPGDAFSWVETFVHKTPLYMHPAPAAQREWVGLSDLNIDELENEYMKSAQTAHEFLRAIEAKLRSKNNG